MRKRLLLASLGLCTLSSMLGCGPRTRPYDHEVDAFLLRREFVLTQVGRVRPPMEGTSYTGTTMHKSEHPRSDDFLFMPPHKHVRLGVEEYGYWMSDHPFIEEFEVTLEDDLVNTATTGEIARRLNRHYASELIERGWHLAGLSVGGNGFPEEERRYSVTYTWSDLGRENPANDSISINSNDLRRGYFKVTIAVCVDTQSRRAHILISLLERLGVVYMG